MNLATTANDSDTAAEQARTRSDAEWLQAHWMPFTGNRNFKANPRLIVEASGAYFTDADGRKV
ncbi:MAG: aspartate aminotransferase family protein, partial [Burkholderiales bacterium]|nr:aspartate aminotransferase family protein [Burkholderiales bacterium]